jgi:hypothetical protein
MEPGVRGFALFACNLKENCMRSMKARFQLCAMLLLAAVPLLPHTAMIQKRLTRTAPEASGRPIMTTDGGDPVPKVPTPKPPKPTNALAA